MSGISPTTFALLARKLVREVESWRVSGIVHGGRLVLLLMLKDWRLVRPERKSGGMELKAFSSRLTCSREGRFERGGNGPESLFRWRLRALRAERRLRSGGIVPERDFDERLMEVTLPEESQLMPCHLQKAGPVQVGMGGVRDLARLAITDASSEEAWWRKAENIVIVRNNLLCGRDLCRSLGIVVVVVVCFFRRWRVKMRMVVVGLCLPTWQMRGWRDGEALEGRTREADGMGRPLVVVDYDQKANNFFIFIFYTCSS